MEEQHKQEQTIPSVLKGLDEAVFYFSDWSLTLNPRFLIQEEIACLGFYQMQRYASPIEHIIQPPQ